MAKKKARKKEKILVKPSELPLDGKVDFRINQAIKDYLLSKGYSLTDIFSESIDSVLPEVDRDLLVKALSGSKKKTTKKKHVKKT